MAGGSRRETYEREYDNAYCPRKPPLPTSAGDFRRHPLSKSGVGYETQVPTRRGVLVSPTRRMDHVAPVKHIVIYRSRSNNTGLFESPSFNDNEEPFVVHPREDFACTTNSTGGGLGGPMIAGENAVVREPSRIVSNNNNNNNNRCHPLASNNFGDSNNAGRRCSLSSSDLKLISTHKKATIEPTTLVKSPSGSTLEVQNPTTSGRSRLSSSDLQKISTHKQATIEPNVLATSVIGTLVVNKSPTTTNDLESDVVRHIHRPRSSGLRRYSCFKPSTPPISSSRGLRRASAPPQSSVTGISGGYPQASRIHSHRVSSPPHINCHSEPEIHCYNSEESEHYHDNNSSAAAAATAAANTYVQIQPGLEAPLRRTEETLDAIQHDYITQQMCMGCSTELYCIADAQYFICPICRVISMMTFPVEMPEGSCHGVGLGFIPNGTTGAICMAGLNKFFLVDNAGF